MIGLLVTVLLFPLVGWSIGRRSIGEAFLFGVGLTGSILFIAGVAHVPLIVALILIVISALISAWRIRGGDHETIRYPRLPTVLMLLPFIALSVIAAITPLNDFDGRAFWALKAKGIAHERAIDGPFFKGATLDPRNHYPILIPLDGAVILGMAHDLDDRHLRWFYLALLAALALLVRERIGRLVSPTAGAWCAAILVWISQFVVEPEGSALSAYNDIALAAFVAGAFFELIAADSPSRFGLWLAFLVLTKSEGLPLSIVFLVIGVFVFRKRIVTPAIVAGVAAISLFFWRLRIPAGDDEEHIVGMLSTIPVTLHRIVDALGAFPRHMLLLPRWGIFWIVVIIAAALAMRVDQRAARLAIAVIASILVIYAGVYMATVWIVADLIAVTADRLLMHVIAPSLFLLARAAVCSDRTS
jgi:hypothetical protein